jgi:nucleotide-binding universal stress UspA family protein
MQNITVFLDGSTYGASVCDHGVWAARQLAMPVMLVHVLGRRAERSSEPADLSGSLRLGARSTLLEKLARHDQERAALARERGRAVLDDALARMTAAGDVEVSTRLRSGDFVEAITELEAETRFAIIGKRGEAADFNTMALGSNVDRAVRATGRPILIASRAFRPIRRFLFAFDGSPSTRRALDRLREGSVLGGVACDLLSVGSDDAARTAISEAAGTLRAAGFDVTEHVRSGEPERVIAEAVAEFGTDLLVLGKSGNSRLRRLFIGSTTLELMRTCTVPVLIFP